MSRPTSSVRVLHVLAPARQGGLERVVAMLSERQGRDKAHIAAVLTPDDVDEHPFISAVESSGIPLTQVLAGSRSYLHEYRSLSALAARLQPAVIHTHGYREDVLGGAVARAHRLPAVSTVHGFTGGGRRNRLNEMIQCLALRRADAVLAVSRPLVDRLDRAGVSRDRIHLIPNGFAPPVNTMTRVAARRTLGIADDVVLAGWVGRLSREKGADVMLEALAQTDASWCLSMIGDGPERDRLRKQAEELGIGGRVLWHGAVANAGAVFRAFDAFVLSSRTEGTPIALFEAMHASVPIVAARVGGVPDVVTSRHALLVPSEDPAAIANALAELRREPAAATSRSELARERVLQTFSVDVWADAVEEIYRAVCR